MNGIYALLNLGEEGFTCEFTAFSNAKAVLTYLERLEAYPDDERLPYNEEIPALWISKRDHQRRWLLTWAPVFSTSQVRSDSPTATTLQPRGHDQDHLAEADDP